MTLLWDLGLVSRYREPLPRSSVYITPEGCEKLRIELEERWVTRREVVKHLSAAAAEGDRSENAEYIYRKKQLAEIDRRIRYLQKRIPTLNVVESTHEDGGKIYFGAWVTVVTDENVESCHRIVGADETDSAKNWISVDSPMSRALLGKSVDDELEVQTPNGRVRYAVIDVAYKME